MVMLMVCVPTLWDGFASMKCMSKYVTYACLRKACRADGHAKNTQRLLSLSLKQFKFHCLTARIEQAQVRTQRVCVCVCVCVVRSKPQREKVRACICERCGRSKLSPWKDAVHSRYRARAVRAEAVTHVVRVRRVGAVIFWSVKRLHQYTMLLYRGKTQMLCALRFEKQMP
jgi:hypothetical protein